MKATMLDLRYRMKNVLGALDRGEAVTIFYRGKEKARLIPISPLVALDEGAALTKDQSLFGLWRDRDDLADPDLYVRSLRQNRQIVAPLGKFGNRC